jgi:hypothetical protein
VNVRGLWSYRAPAGAVTVTTPMVLVHCLRASLIMASCLGCAAPRANVAPAGEAPRTAHTASVGVAAPGRASSLEQAVFSIVLPTSWHLALSEPDHVILSKVAQPGAALHPTIEVYVEPKRERYDAPALVEKQAQRLFDNLDAHITVPFDWSDAELSSNGLSGNGILKVEGKSYEVRWHYYDASTATQHLVIASLCAQQGPLACEQEFEQMTGSFTKSAHALNHRL